MTVTAGLDDWVVYIIFITVLVICQEEKPFQGVIGYRKKIKQ